jgi:hypothetical protein
MNELKVNLPQLDCQKPFELAFLFNKVSSIIKQVFDGWQPFPKEINDPSTKID